MAHPSDPYAQAYRAQVYGQTWAAIERRHAARTRFEDLTQRFRRELRDTPGYRVGEATDAEVELQALNLAGFALAGEV